MLKGNCVSVESETIVRVYMLILYISNNHFAKIVEINNNLNNLLSLRGE